MGTWESIIRVELRRSFLPLCNLQTDHCMENGALNRLALDHYPMHFPPFHEVDYKVKNKKNCILQPVAST
jgi:hypothetical protein